MQLRPPSNNAQEETPNEYAIRLYKQFANDEKEPIVIRFRANEMFCEGCVRITVGSEEENEKLLNKWQRFLSNGSE